MAAPNSPASVKGASTNRALVRARTLLVVLAACGFAACLGPVREPDCLKDGTCECKVREDCDAGAECVNGKCFVVPDAGLPGEQGWPCTDDSQCLFGPCLAPGPGNGRVCSAVCAIDGGTGCNKGWDCKQGDGRFLCVPPIRVQCLSCNQDSDCNALGDRCTTVGGSKACVTDCSLTGQCPTGSVCRSVGLDAGSARLCIPQSNSCECSALSAGLTRSCKRTTPRATCFGDETCQANGTWSGCSALTASDEVCDGVDNDCDGLTDQADPDLVTSAIPGYPNCRKGTACTGLWSCRGSPDAGYAFSCSAPDPKPETCNGADDDCNGQVDDGLVDAMGNYISVHACGSCATDCDVVLDHLENDAGVVLPGAASCDVRAGQRTCVPRRCEKGSTLSPATNPIACVPVQTSQCRPCTTADDCTAPGDDCQAVGNDVEPSCLQACDSAALRPGCTGVVGDQGCCPTGSFCQQVGAKKLCVPRGNSCQCNAAHVGFTRSCLVTNAGATCIGSQTCMQSGSFNTCDTSMTSLELCDGRDNNCDGKIDEGFVNTRNTGTYDTDEHCGSCTTNCLARYSATIQHAVGGCFPMGGPHCAIARCTTERVGGGGPCRVSSDCSPGLTCDGLYHQCVKPCSTTTPCGGGETCSNGYCTRGCNSDTDCTSAYGAGATCSMGTCGTTFQFVDADADDTNGCECASNPSLVDAPELFPTYPAGNQPYVDRNCDTVDGVSATSLFVWAQSTSSQGTRRAPFRTIREALMAFRPGVHTAILVAQGTYAEQVVLTNGVQLFGGYSPDFSRRDIVNFPTFIEAAEPTGAQPRGTVNAEGLSATTIIAGFTIRGYDVISRPAPGVQARSSFAIYVSNSPGLVVQNDHVVGGRGGDASAASSGLAGANGGAGQDGLNAKECNSPDCSGETQVGGQPGNNNTCPATTRGNVGAGSDLQLDPQAYAGGGINGTGGSNAVYQHSDPSQAALCKYDCTVPGTGLQGGAAQNGGDGQPQGPGFGCTAPRGMIAGGDWATGIGSTGNDGSPGRGGGGGGAGGCVSNQNPSSCTVGRRVGDLGGTGGGGGAGGCGGTKGLAGAGGGASFAIFIVGAAPTVQGNLFDFGFGGFGGNGGAGGYGGLGGQGGRGGLNTTAAWCAGQGGPGGRGGNGGAGSGGGGGCGGSVFLIGGTGISGAGYPMRNTFPAVPMGAVGAGGIGGASPAGVSFKGSDGSTGIISTVESF
ncbi:MAG: MopE-related protein [Myxococcaceae bacterium]